tara:strand:- start:235 stop:414 length:180 start_codon:yes stop_codon:yes gene_type:complete
MVKWSMDEVDRRNAELLVMKSKVAKQRNEIARLTMALEKVTKEKVQLFKDVQWMRGEYK